MTVYLVMRTYDYEGSVVLGVFSSREAAEACEARYIALGDGYIGDGIDIDERTVDQLPDDLLEAKS